MAEQTDLREWKAGAEIRLSRLEGDVRDLSATLTEVRDAGMDTAASAASIRRSVGQMSGSFAGTVQELKDALKEEVDEAKDEVKYVRHRIVPELYGRITSLEKWKAKLLGLFAAIAALVLTPWGDIFVKLTGGD